MPDYADLFAAASSLPLDQRMQLIDDLTDTLPETAGLSPEWQAEIERRGAEIESGAVETTAWETVREDLFRRVGLNRGT